MATLGTFEGAIDVTDLLKVFAPFQGTIIIALDAGDVVADAEVYCEKNDFLLLLKNVVEKEVNNERLWVLTSHSPSEISQDDIVSGHRLFDNALAESLLGAVRLPKAEETKLIWANDRIFTLDELANYVHRRVYVDSSKKQSPWLLRGGTGVVRSDKSNWPEATKIRIANLNRDGSIVGLAPKPQKVDSPKTSPSEPPSSEDGPQSPLKSTPDQPEKLTENVRKLSDDIWVNRWKVFEESWEKPAMPNQKQAWAFAECYPAAYREARGKLMNDELRSRAGIETSTTRVDPEIPPLNVDDLERFKSLFEPGTKGKRLDPLELKEAQNKAVIVQSICRASLSVAEARQLRLRLNALNETFRPQLLRLIQSFTATANQPLDRNTLSKSSLNQLPSQLELQRELESIVDEATRISTNKPALLESLLLCGIIGGDRRQKARQMRERRVKSAA